MEENNEQTVQFPKEESDSMTTDNFFQMFTEAFPGAEGAELLGAIITLPDEDFEAMKPILLEELEKGFNNSNDKYALAMMMSQSGASVEELRETLTEILNQVDDIFKDYSESKRDFIKQIFLFLQNSLESGKGLHNRIISIPIELCHPDAKIPTYAHDSDAGCDVYALDDYTLEPHQTMLIPLGFKVAIPAGYELQMRPRSGMSLRTKARIANAPGTIDSGYRDEVGVIMDNIGDYPFYITKGQRIAQMVLHEVPVAAFYQVESVSAIGDDRGGGYGSSGK